MACHLEISDKERECEGCAAVIRPGIVAMTNEVIGAWCPMCLGCLKSLDWRLAIAWASIHQFGSLRALRHLREMERLVGELPELPDVGKAREELRRRWEALDDEAED